MQDEEKEFYSNVSSITRRDGRKQLKNYGSKDGSRFEIISPALNLIE